MNTQKEKIHTSDSCHITRFEKDGNVPASIMVGDYEGTPGLTAISDENIQSYKIMKMDQIPGQTLYEMRMEYSKNKDLVKILVDIKNTVKFKKRTFL